MQPAQESKLRILIIDDAEDFRDNMRFFFEENFEIVEASSFEEAKRVITSEKDLSLIILDLKLHEHEKGYNGQKLIPFIRKKSRIPIIIITGYSNDETIEIVGATGQDVHTKTKAKLDYVQLSDFISTILEEMKGESDYYIVSNYFADSKIAAGLNLFKRIMEERNFSKWIGEATQILAQLNKLEEARRKNTIDPDKYIRDRNEILDNALTIIEAETKEAKEVKHILIHSFLP